MSNNTTPKRRGRPFTKGHDPRRHRFTTEECSKGFQAALESIITRHPDAIMRDGRHMACLFLRSKARKEVSANV